MRVNIYSESLPFIQKFRGKTIVVKYGGAAMKSESLQSSVITDLVLLSCVGLRIVLVHGGGPEINHWLTRLGIQPNFLNGLRVTDASTMEVVSMVLVGKLNKHLVSLSSTRPAPPPVRGRHRRGRPFRSPPSHREQPHPGDCVGGGGRGGAVVQHQRGHGGGGVGGGTGRGEKLILLTDVAGILEDKDDPGSLVKEIDIKGVKRMIEGGKIGGGMIPKVNCCVRSIAQGVRTASIIDGRVPHSLLLEILTDQGAGTMIIG
ncbi:N-acetyl-l-glutamate kinase [Actinidia rufa]|uniref:N-acetyl-l-glutamate kinase n=1 Tax=Actinidia rufa TaxID=165716 RepID=A0A7J0DUM9_9ERIC|nr:N-acetyl-l-glutamate kinase [Actinidia rufa]